jgi:UPF0148 protein
MGWAIGIMSDVKKMAEALRSGATMLAEPCPTCGSPLFRFRSGEVKCVNCDKIVMPVAEQRPPEPASAMPLLEKEVLGLLSEYGGRLEKADFQEAGKLLAQIDACLTVIQKIRALGQSSSARGAP